jgi:hypothetical protein
MREKAAENLDEHNENQNTLTENSDHKGNMDNLEQSLEM